MSATNPFPAEGGCDCRLIRDRLESEPLFVHGCHCRWCQRASRGDAGQRGCRCTTF